MAVFVIEGGRPLRGVVRVSGRKNAAVAVLPAALLAEGPSTIENIPDIGDVATALDLLRAQGASVEVPAPGTVRIDPTGLRDREPPAELAGQMRASYYLLGVLLARFRRAVVPLPGGCDIGRRPIDQHLKGLAALGARLEIADGRVRAEARRLQGASIYLDVVSVGATINLMLAAATAEGTTVIENAAKEPHIVDVANFLNAMGAHVSGAGTDVIKVRGVKRLHGAEHAIIPDEIEAATYMFAAAGTLGDVLVENVIPRHLEPISAKLREAGVEVVENGEWVRVVATERPRAVRIKTLPYPGFPTDAQQPATALWSIGRGTTLVTESIWEDRFRHVPELLRMGARIEVRDRTLVVEGVPRLRGVPVTATDLRSGAALVIAGLLAEGVTTVSRVELVDRGYEAMEAKLAALGAVIRRQPSA
ncbi:MAG: UDP-N-acetylglucosamine 1-carboxyvinyltransferase [Clostridia bacterium]|nr:UDP-N-acetylglucosamine 1-carboxyvinyltransferase [Clostridia bacterium]